MQMFYIYLCNYGVDARNGRRNGKITQNDVLEVSIQKPFQ